MSHFRTQLNALYSFRLDWTIRGSAVKQLRSWPLRSTAYQQPGLRLYARGAYNAREHCYTGDAGQGPDSQRTSLGIGYNELEIACMGRTVVETTTCELRPCLLLSSPCQCAFR